jgi:hypothetical protein
MTMVQEAKREKSDAIAAARSVFGPLFSARELAQQMDLLTDRSSEILTWSDVFCRVRAAAEMLRNARAFVATNR